MAGLSSSVDVNTVLYNKTGKLHTSGNKGATCKYKLYENKPEKAVVSFGIWKAKGNALLFALLHCVALRIFLFYCILNVYFSAINQKVITVSLYC